MDFWCTVASGSKGIRTITKWIATRGGCHARPSINGGSVNRLAAVDEAAPFRLVSLQYVDDTMAPASSTAHVVELCRAATNFSCTHGGTFNVGPSKSAALPIGATCYDAEDPGAEINGVRVGRVETYKYLGILVDRWLSFSPQLQYLLKRGRIAFAEFAGAAESMQLPFPLQAAAVMHRVAGNVLYGTKFAISAPSAELAFNRLQSEWARRLLRIDGRRAGAWPLLLSECGWVTRLGTRMLELALLLHARVLLLPGSHPAQRLLLSAMTCSLTTWAAAVRGIQRKLGDSQPLPDITAYFSDQQVRDARACRAEQRKLLFKYKMQVTRPARIRYDREAFFAACQATEWDYSDLVHEPCQFPRFVFDLNWGPRTWLLYIAWAVVRATWRWPLAVFSGGDLPRILPHCPLCIATEAGIDHLLLECAGTRVFFNDWILSVSFSASHQWEWSSLRAVLFSGNLDPLLAHGHLTANILYVGRCCVAAAEQYGIGDSLQSEIDRLIIDAASSSAA